MSVEEEKNESTFEDEEMIVYVKFDEDIENYSKDDLINTKVLGLDTDEPILQLGNKVFGGSWNEIVGTALFFEETEPVERRCYFSEKVPKPLKYVNKTTKMLNLKRVFISEKIKSSGDGERGIHSTKERETPTSDENHAPGSSDVKEEQENVGDGGCPTQSFN